MTKEQCFELGIITKTHALKGEVIIFLDTDTPEEYAEINSVFLEINNSLVPYFIKHINLQGSKAIVKFEEIDTIDKAQELINCKLWLSLESLPDLEDGQFYYHQIIGYQIIDEQNGKLGKITNIYEGNMQDIIAMEYQGKEVLIPMVDAIVKDANHSSQELYVILPEGLLELYLEE